MNCYAKAVPGGYSVVSYDVARYYTADLTEKCPTSGYSIVLNPEMHDKILAAADFRNRQSDLLVQAMMKPFADFVEASKQQMDHDTNSVEGKLEQLARIDIAQNLKAALDEAFDDTLCPCALDAQRSLMPVLIESIENPPAPKPHNPVLDVLRRMEKMMAQ